MTAYYTPANNNTVIKLRGGYNVTGVVNAAGFTATQTTLGYMETN